MCPKQTYSVCNFNGILSATYPAFATGRWYIQDSGVTEFLRDVWFVDSLRGWICGGGVILHTADGCWISLYRMECQRCAFWYLLLQDSNTQLYKD